MDRDQWRACDRMLRSPAMPTFQVITRDGVPILATSAEDAIALAKAIAANELSEQRKARRRTERDQQKAPTAPARTQTAEPVSQSREARQFDGWTAPAALTEYIWKLNKTQRAAIVAIATAKGPISIDEIGTTIGISHRRQTSIVLSRCATIAKKSGLEWPQVVVFKIKGAREQRTSIYWAGPLLREKGNASAA